MQRLTALWIFLCFVVAACMPTPAVADDWSLNSSVKRQSMWSGFGIGTVVHHRSRTDVEIRGEPDPTRKRREETMSELIRIEEGEFVVKVKRRVNGQWETAEERQPCRTLSELRIKAIGTGSVTIEGRDYPCTKKIVSDVRTLLGDPMSVPKRGSKADETAGTVWEHKKLGILKIEMRVASKGQSVLTTLVVTNLGVSHRVGQRSLPCRELTWTCSALGGKTVRLESLAVPGRTVLRKGAVEVGPVSMTSLKELVSLTTKPASARTETGPDTAKSESIDNIKVILTFMVYMRTTGAGWPRYNGKNFVLSLVATNQIDRRNKTNLSVLFSPSDPAYRLEDVDLKRYEAVTKKALKSGADFHELTSYAGRRNRDADATVTPRQEMRGTPVIADLTHPDGIIFGFSSGAVRFMTWAELDMQRPVGPVVVGPKASHDYLRLLSDK